MKNNKLKRNNGITLIALVITIIVMLILVAVTISMAVNGGLFEYAQYAGTQTNGTTANEQLLASGQVTIDGTVYNSITEYVNSGKEEVAPNPTETFSAIYETNTLMTEGTYTAMIPKGFAVGTSNGINTIAGGLVITDKVNDKGQSIGNEFVWIPVKYTETKTDTDNNGYDDGFDSVFYRSNWSNNARGTTKYTDTTGSSYNEPLSSGGYTNEVAEYNEMLKSVYQNKGFYIGRYEAGSTTARTDKANETTQMVVKRDVYPYNYVGWGPSMTVYTGDVTYSSKNQGLGALALSKAMYANKNVGVTSTLCYGIQWDAMLDFIKDANHNVTNSIEWGNYKNNAVIIDRPTARWTSNPSSDTTWTQIGTTAKNKTNSESILLTTGAENSFSAKNIFDVAGNVYEWTNEADSSGYRFHRGGYYLLNGSNAHASCRYSGRPYYCNYNLGFRAVLYIS